MVMKALPERLQHLILVVANHTIEYPEDEGISWFDIGESPLDTSSPLRFVSPNGIKNLIREAVEDYKVIQRKVTQSGEHLYRMNQPRWALQQLVDDYA